VNTTVLTLVLGLIVGGLSGILGIGGGVFLIPGLIYLLNFEPQKAQGTTLAAMVPPIGLGAALQYYKSGYVDIRAALCIAAGFSVGAYITSGYVQYISSTTLTQIFGSLLLFLGVRMVIMSDRVSAVMFGSMLAWTLTWGSYFIFRRWGKRYGVRPNFRSVAKEFGAGSPPTVDYQI
jgi:uncharacterized membrane protein YfcA